MKTIHFLKSLAMALSLATLASLASTVQAALLVGFGGDTFALSPTATPGTFTDTVNGAARVSLLGNCSFHAEQSITFPAAPDQPLVVKGVWRFTSSDGTTTMNAEASGTGTPDPVNAGFINLHLEIKFTGGTGKFANARGKGEIDGVGMLTSATGGIATWSLKGLLVAPGLED